jgi:hypothetical protein
LGILPDERRLEEGEMLCRVADEPVVVMKFPPVKPGNGVEEKTETTCSHDCRGCWRAKSAGSCEGVKFYRKFRKRAGKVDGEQAA